MAKISKKNAEDIATQYNKIYVGELMLKDCPDESVELWKNHIREAVDFLRVHFGIRVIGYR